ncbi:MAG: flagellin [Georgfuchsia sp.]
MSSMINTNINSLVAQNSLQASQNSLATAMQRLSSGLRINSAKDDAAGLAVSTLMNAQVLSINQAVRNANDGISMLQTAEGGMQEQQTMLQRMRELAVQASSDTIDDTDRGYINTELQALKDEINSVATRTVFNGQSLLTGALQTTQSGGTAVVGLSLATTHVATVSSISVAGAKADTFTLSSGGAGTITLTRSSDNAAQTVAVAAIADGGSASYDFSTLGVKISVQNTTGAVKAAADLITDLSAKTVITTGGGSAASIQVGANAADTMSISFSDTQISATNNAGLDGALTTFDGSSTSTNAQALLTQIDSALANISGQRSDLGANMNRLGHTVSNLQATSTNLSAAQSRITDADFAAETASLTRANILQQAGTAMLAQANSQPNGVMALLQRL